MKIYKQGTKIHSSSWRSILAPLAPISAPLPYARETRHLFHSSWCDFLRPGHPPAAICLLSSYFWNYLRALCTVKTRRSTSRFLPWGWPIRGNGTVIRKPLESLATDQLFTSLLGQPGLPLENKKQDKFVPKKIAPGHKRVIKGCQIHELS